MFENLFLKDRKYPFFIAGSYCVDTFTPNFKNTFYEKINYFTGGISASIVCA